jgi:branched-chain amino acid aminotransferase
MESVTEVRIERVSESRLSGVDLANVEFSRVMSDHMLVAESRDGDWRDANIRAYGPLPLPPNITALQYGISVFEGLKPTGRRQEISLFSVPTRTHVG